MSPDWFIAFADLRHGLITMDIPKIVGLALIPVSLLLIAVMVIIEPTAVFEPPYVLAIMNTLFLGIIPIVIAFIALKVFQRSGSVSMLLTGSGILIFGLGSISAGWLNPLPGGPNMTVTVHNICACIGAIFVLAGAAFGRTGPTIGRGKGNIRIIAALYCGILVFVMLLSLATMQGMLTPFFIPGTGPTLVRQIILENAVVFFAISSLLFMYTHLRGRSDFFFWYSVSFALISIGLLAVFFQPSVGSLIGWVGRSAQYIGFIFALYGGFIARREGIAKDIPLDTIISNFFIDAERSYKQLVDTATDTIVTFDEDYRVMLWNPAAERMFGYTRDEAFGSSFPDLVIADHTMAFIKDEVDLNPDTHPMTPAAFGIECSRKDGTLFPVEMTISRRWQDGRLTYTCILRDLTERKRAEETLRESEEKYHSLFEHMLNGFAYCRMIYDSEGRPEDLIYLNVNQAFDRIVGTKTITGKRITELFPGIREAYPELFEIYGRVALTGKPESFEIDFKPIEKWLHISVYSPEKGYFIAAFEDITERKRAEEALQQVNKRLNLLSSITRHDILNEVAILLGYIDLARDEPPGPRMQEYFNNLGDAANTIQHQIEFTKQYQEIGVKDATWQNVRNTIQKAGLEFTMENVTLTITCGNFEIFADPLLQGVFHNLFDNAFRYAPPFTTISVSCEETEEGLSVVFADDGVGISVDLRKHLFERGFGNHTGLGLFLSREILAITGITITENGEPGKGARFEMTVPKGAYRFSKESDSQ